MSRYDTEFVHMFHDVEKRLQDIENPLHRKILKNYRMHALLEVSGRYSELLAPEMTVEHPVYRLHEGGQSIVLDGMEQVTAFYASLVEADALVMWVSEQDIAVADWGFSGEVVFNQFLPAAMLGESVFSNASAAAASTEASRPLLLRRTLAFVWPYDDRGRLVGEHVYEDTASKEIIEPDPADVITAARASELLAPELANQIP